MGLQKYEDLIVWQKSMDLVVEVYKIVKSLPDEELFVLSNQMRRSAVSIPSNIAEGHERSTTKDYIRFLYNAKSSRAELETQLQICIRLDYLTRTQTETAQSLIVEIGKMLNALIQKLSKKISQTPFPDSSP
jgi:four helix bundle protein